MADTTFGAALVATASAQGASLAVVCGARRLSYADLERESARLASGLLKLGVDHGDHVGIWMSTRAEWIIAFCACARIGAVVVPINTRYKVHEAEYVIAHADVKLLICERQMWDSDSYQMLLSLCPEIARQTPARLDCARLPRLRTVAMVGGQPAAGTLSYDDLLRGTPDTAALAAAQERVRESDPLLICFTSGSTGRPKGALHAHRTLHHSRRIGEVLRMGPDDVLLANWPMYHVAGLFIVLVPAVLFGSTMVLFPHWSGDEALDVIERERVSIVGGISTHYFDLVDAMRRKPRDLSSVKAAYVGGATLSSETFGNIVGTLGLKRLLSTYGMTENTVSTTFNHWDDAHDVCRQNKAPVITSGKVKVVDLSTQQELPAGEEGEIWCSGATLMLGYYKQEEETRKTITEDGWLRTGDLGRFDADGNLQVTGRIKDIVKVGGTNVSPAEVENLLMANPAVEFAVVVGVPDDRLGEVTYAYVKTAGPTAVSKDALIADCRARMASYKVPRHVRFMDEFPRLSTGKIDRKQLGDAARAEVAAGG